MARQTYSVRLWSLPAQASAGSVFGPIVPAGFTWVVRDVRMVNEQSQSGLHVGALVLEDVAGNSITATPTFFSLVGVLYSWEGRAVLAAGSQFQATSTSSGWSLVADGYSLTAT